MTSPAASTHSALYNPDLAPVPLDRRTWGTYNYASLWVAMSVCILTYMLASGLIPGGMNWWQAVGAIMRRIQTGAVAMKLKHNSKRQTNPTSSERSSTGTYDSSRRNRGVNTH